MTKNVSGVSFTSSSQIFKCRKVKKITLKKMKSSENSFVSGLSLNDLTGIKV